MTKASEYRRYAEECRRLASREDFGESRDQLLMMAATWDSLAKERSARVMLDPQEGLDGEHHEEMLHSGIDAPP